MNFLYATLDMIQPLICCLQVFAALDLNINFGLLVTVEYQSNIVTDVYKYLLHLIWFLNIYAALDLNKYSYLYPLELILIYNLERDQYLLDLVLISGDCALDSALNFVFGLLK
ncbi:hypothetical protein ACJX0J_007382 [Zea mays]